MGEGSVLVLDLGTSSLKCGLYSLDGEMRAEARAPMRYFTPAGLSDIAVEFDPEETWGLASGLVRECLEKAGLGGGDVVGVCTTSQRGGFVLLDGEGGAVYSGPNRDVRAFFEGMEIDGRVVEEVYRLTGHTLLRFFLHRRGWRGCGPMYLKTTEKGDSRFAVGGLARVQVVGGGEG